MSERMVTVATFGEPVKAHLAKNRLESAGIKAFLANQETVGMVWHLTNAFGGIKLQVLEADADDAIAILAENVEYEPLLSDELEAEPLSEEVDTSDESAPNTREQNSDRAARGAILGLLLVPLQLYVSWLLLKVLFSKDRLGSVHRRRAIVATAINLPVMFGCCAVVISLWLGPAPPFGADEFSSPASKARAAAFNFNLGENAFQSADYEDAFAHYSRAIALDPEFADAYAGRGGVYAQRTEYDLAIADFSQAIELDPKVQRVFNSRGSAYRGRGDYREAIADHDEAIRKSPDDCYSYLDRAEDYKAVGDDERAFADFDEAIRLKPNHITYAARALAYMDKADYPKAVADCNEVLRLNPDYFRGYSLRGMAYAAMSRPDDAIADYNQSLRMNPRNYHDYTVRGMAYMDKGDCRSALVDFDSAIKIDPQQPMAYSERAKAHRKLGDAKSADRDHDEARRLNERPPSHEK